MNISHILQYRGRERRGRIFTNTLKNCACGFRLELSINMDRDGDVIHRLPNTIQILPIEAILPPKMDFNFILRQSGENVFENLLYILSPLTESIFNLSNISEFSIL